MAGLVSGVLVISSIMLVCAVALSLGVGVLAAYAVVVGMFRVFRVHAIQVARARVPKAAATRLGVAGN